MAWSTHRVDQAYTFRRSFPLGEKGVHAVKRSGFLIAAGAILAARLATQAHQAWKVFRIGLSGCHYPRVRRSSNAALFVQRRLGRYLMLLALLSLASGTSFAVTVDELIARHIEARGGSERIKAIQSLQFSGKLELTGDLIAEFSLIRQIKRPDRVRVESTLQGLTSVRVWDGHEGWVISPLFGRKDPERISRDESKDLIEIADIDGPLIDSANKGYRVDYLGTEDLEGTEAHKLRVIANDGDVQYVYLDPDYYVVIRIIYQRSVRGAQVETETDFGNYEKVNAVYFPFSIDSGPKGEAKTQKIIIDKAEANVPLSDTLFQFPASAK
jgi:hypothetical protein